MVSPLLDRYEILEELHSSGFSSTFLAKDLQMSSQRQVVLKCFKPLEYNQISSDLIEELFSKEASHLEDLGANCTEIPTLYAYFSSEGKFYLVQEYIEGKSLAQLDIITYEQCFSILSSLLTTLQYVHSKKIIHQNIKPENIIIRAKDNIPVLIDFGAIKEIIGTPTGNSSSNLNSVRGFIAPEQITGTKVFSSDLYSLGLTMIYSLTGKLPAEISINTVTGELDWQAYVPNLNSQLKTVLEKAINTDINNRYPTAAKMAQALHRTSLESIDINSQVQALPKQVTTSSSSSQVIPVPESPTKIAPTTPAKSASQNNFIPIVLTAILVAIGVSTGFLIIQQMRETQQKLAEAEREKIEIENLLAEERKKREEAELLRVEVEKNRLEAEKLRQESEKKAANNRQTVLIPIKPSSQPSPFNSTNRTSTNARIGGKTGWKNIRSGPGTDYSIVGEGYTGQAIQILGSGRDRGGYLWYRVYHPESGTRGWIAAQLVNLN